MSFRAGQKVVCVHKGHWFNYINGDIYTGPKEHDIVTISNLVRRHGVNGLQFSEWPCNNYDNDPAYAADDFRPIDYSFGEKVATEITEQVEKTFKEETIESMTTLRLDKKHRPTAEKIFADAGIEVEFWNMENTDTCRLFIYSDEAEILFLIGIAIGQAIEFEDLKTLV